MEKNEILNELNKLIKNKQVKFTRIAANSLILYIECIPGDLTGITIWIEPTWHMCCELGLLIGSRQLQEDFSEDMFVTVTKPIEDLLECKIESVLVDILTYDLSIKFDNGYYIRTFAVDPNDDFLWYVKDLSKNKKILGTPKGYLIE